MKNAITLIFAVIFAIVAGFHYKSWNAAIFGLFLGAFIGDTLFDCFFKKTN